MKHKEMHIMASTSQKRPAEVIWMANLADSFNQPRPKTALVFFYITEKWWKENKAKGGVLKTLDDNCKIIFAKKGYGIEDIQELAAKGYKSISVMGIDYMETDDSALDSLCKLSGIANLYDCAMNVIIDHIYDPKEKFETFDWGFADVVSIVYDDPKRDTHIIKFYSPASRKIVKDKK